MAVSWHTRDSAAGLSLDARAHACSDDGDVLVRVPGGGAAHEKPPGALVDGDGLAGSELCARVLDSLRVLHNDTVQSRELKQKQKAAQARGLANDHVVRLLNVWILIDGNMEPLGVVPCPEPYVHRRASTAIRSGNGPSGTLDTSNVRLVLVDMPRFCVLLFDTEKVPRPHCEVPLQGAIRELRQTR